MNADTGIAVVQQDTVTVIIVTADIADEFHSRLTLFRRHLWQGTVRLPFNRWQTFDELIDLLVPPFHFWAPKNHASFLIAWPVTGVRPYNLGVLKNRERGRKMV